MQVAMPPSLPVDSPAHSQRTYQPHSGDTVGPRRGVHRRSQALSLAASLLQPQPSGLGLEGLISSAPRSPGATPCRPLL